LPPARKYPEAGQRRDKVFFVHFPMVQTELLLLSKGTPRFNLEEMIYAEWHNQYFGHGLSSIVFQEIRESKALAYATYAYFSNPGKRNRAHYLQAYRHPARQIARCGGGIPNNSERHAGVAAAD